MKKILLILLLISASSFSNEKNEKLDLYDLGAELSRCAGDYEFASMMHKLVFKDPSMSKLLHEHSNGWLTAGIANYYFSGLTSEASKISAAGKKETKITQWVTGIELMDKTDTKALEVLMEDLNSQILYCSSWDDMVVLSQKMWTKEWHSKPEIEDF